MSRELVLGMSVSMDGFVSGPNGEIDWIFRHRTEESTQWIVDRLGQVGLHLMGRKSYEAMADFWPTSPMPMARAMNEVPKAVFSRNGQIATPSMTSTLASLESSEDKQALQAALESWQNPTVGGADLVADIQKLKAEDGKPINALGGASFASSLIAAGLVDAFHLMVHPVALGSGLPLFATLESPLFLKLEELKAFESGAVAKIFRPLRVEG